jgi:hypothetical protein
LVRKPTGIDERPEQLRPPIKKSTGGTESERYLARVADRSFLNLWSYPSPYRDQKINGSGDGKELCDLLVVCGEHIIIFSEKTIDWPSGDVETAWCRWSKRAIRDSAKQTKGAERWLAEFPERIYLDSSCSEPFPIDLPSLDNRRVHRVVIANGSTLAVQKHTSGLYRSLTIRPSVVGDGHWTPTKDGSIQPFAVGDIDPHGSFVHVFDEVALDVVMSELDTVRDFTDYLTKKAEFVRSGKLEEAQGEENLLAYYAIRINEAGDHDFVVEDGKAPLTIDHEGYSRFTSNPRYQAKKHADKISYLWDRLIEAFTNHMLAGTSITLKGFEFDLRETELGVRQMALIPRFQRRSYAEAVADALEQGKKKDKFVRVMMSPARAKDAETAFFIVTLKYLDWMEAKGGYEKYREVRAGLMMIYARGLLERHEHLRRVIGISREPSDQGRGVSEDIIYVEQHDWTDEQRAAIKEDCERAGVLQNLRERRFGGAEFPEVETITIKRPGLMMPNSEPNRKQRRAMKARARKSHR